MTVAPRLTLCLGGDLMTGRGIDQVMAHACPPRLYEPWATSARDYVRLAERAHGPIARPVDPAYVWGDALDALRRHEPDACLVNLETSVTTSEDAQAKGINYRMHPANVAVLTAPHIDCCVLANNHVLDWGRAGLLETLDVLEHASLRIAGAGRDERAAERPARIPVRAGGRVLVFAFGADDCGIPPGWAARADAPGIQLVDVLDDATVARIAAHVERERMPGDVVVASIHWGPNWGYGIADAHRDFAHALIERAHVDVVHGHSSHHPKAIEIHQDRPILYGCGELIDDYEGIHGHEAYRGDLVLLYWVTLDAASGALAGLAMTPFVLRRFRLCRPTLDDRAWLRATMDRECRRFGHRVMDDGDEFRMARD